MGTTLLAEGRKAEAQQYLTFAPKVADRIAASTPQSWQAALNLAAIQYNAHQPDAAVAILDDAMRRYPNLWDLEQYRAESGCTILLASHNMAEVERLCTDVVMLKQGRVVDRGSPGELLERYGRHDLEAVFLDIARDRRAAVPV